MTIDIFSDWLLKFDNQMSIHKRKVILLLDNAGCHSFKENTVKKLTNTFLKYLHPGTTSKIQP